VNPVIDGEPSVIQPIGVRVVRFERSRPEARGDASSARDCPRNDGIAVFDAFGFFKIVTGISDSFGWNYPKGKIIPFAANAVASVQQIDPENCS